MTTKNFVNISVDSKLKQEASDVLSGMGLTVADLVRITLTKIAKEKALPFDIQIPNKLTKKTIENSENKIDIYTVKDSDDLFKKLDI